ncbi:MAG TPA: hypothetical protein VG204_06960 [Terriglobia bacterium]|nr:hypothetical protein [Terriglobia bacterium]
MNKTKRRVIQAIGLLLLVAGTGSALKAQVSWKVSDVFVGAGHGSYLHYTNIGTDSSPNYVLVETIAVSGFGSGDQTSGCAWDSQLNFYATDTKSGLVAELNGNTHAVVQTLSTGLSSTSVMFDSSGNLYVGNANVAGTLNAGVLKYVPNLPPNSSTGTITYPTSPTKTFNTGTNSDWIDLANNQKTLYLTGEGFVVDKEDLSAAVPTPMTFSTSALNQAFAVRLLPPFDGTGGLLLADSNQVVQLDSNGAIVPGSVLTFTKSSNLRALTLDPNGTSAWVADLKNGNVFRFNISTGTVEFTIATPGGSSPNGLCVKGGPELNVVPLVYNVGTNVGATAGFGDPKTVNFHTWGATIDTVNTKFILVLTATEGIDLHRFDEYFCNQAVGGNSFGCTAPTPPPPFSPTLTSLPYADQVNFAGTAVQGKPVVYRAANPPPDTSFSGNIFIYVTYNVPPSYSPPACPVGNATVSVSDPRLFRDPSSSPPADAASNHSFAFDSTTFTKLGDSGTGGIIPKLNDFNVADRCPTSVGSSVTFLSPLPKTNVNLGSSVSLAISVVDASGNPITDAVTSPNNITLSVTGQNGVPEREFGVPGNSPNFFKITPDNKYKANLDTSSFELGLTTLCVTSINESFLSGQVGTATATGEFPPACTVINLQ